MKAIYIFSFALIFSLSLTAKAQGNLQFNRVVQQTLDINVLGNGTPITISTITVPEGKVWKIENVSVTRGAGIHLQEGRLLIGGHCLWAFVTSYGADRSESPLWLPSGTFDIQVSHTLGGTVSVKTAYSAIEFNIIP